MMDKKPMQEELLNSVAGGVEIGIPSGNDNMYQSTTEDIERRWKVIVQRKEWKFKDKEMELKAQQMWINAGMDLLKSGTDIAKLCMGGA
ncbi:MAG: hypothetical protein J6O13_16680 [Selenomonas sp.]|nr:hypothetical protein [Selenomonas sp.]